MRNISPISMIEYIRDLDLQIPLAQLSLWEMLFKAWTLFGS